MSFKEKMKKLKIKIAAVYLAFKHEETPKLAKVMAGITIAYALSPIDLIPDFIPVLGYLDDLIILPMLVTVCIKLIPTEVMAECERDALGLWDNGKPKSWIFAIPIIIFWVATLMFVLYLISK